MRIKRVALALLLAAAACGCLPTTATVTPVKPSPMASPTGTPLSATATPLPPTRTPVPPTATPMPSIVGQITAWRPGVPVASRRVFVCRVVDELDAYPSECVLQDTEALSDEGGRFQMVGLEPGTYELLYDSGTGDLEAALQRWKGQHLELHDIEWLEDEYFLPDSEGNCSFQLVAGMPLMESDFLWYVVGTLQYCDSPLLLAHNIQKTFDIKELAMTTAVVADGTSSQVEFAVLYFGE